MSRVYSGILFLVSSFVFLVFGIGNLKGMVAYYMGPVYDLAVNGMIMDADTKQSITNLRLTLLYGKVTNQTNSTYDGSYYDIGMMRAKQGKYTIIVEDPSKKYKTTKIIMNKKDIPLNTNLTIYMKKRK